MRRRRFVPCVPRSRAGDGRTGAVLAHPAATGGRLRPGAALKGIVVAFALSLPTACAPAPSIAHLHGPTMGSTYSIQYVPTARGPAPATLKARIEAILAEVDRQMSTWRADSDLQRFNQAPAGTCLPMPPPVMALARYAMHLNELSEGAFDPTLGPLLDLWGFGAGGTRNRPPGPQAIAEARARTGIRFLRLDRDRMCKDAGIALDFNAIAAGDTVDRIAEHLGELGIDSYLVEVTGELKAAGRKPDGSHWRIAIESPQEHRRVADRVIDLDGHGVATSGDYRNYFEQDGERYSHTLDPRTGAPIRHALAAVTVIHRSAREADGLSTVLMVLGPEAGYAFAVEHGLAALFATREGDGFASRATPQMEALFPAIETP